MNNRINSYSLKLWLTVAAISFVIFQVMLYFFNYNNSNSFSEGYGTAIWDFTKSWLVIITLLTIPWFFNLRITRALYQAYWSARGFKLATLLVSEFLMLFFLIIFFSVFNSNYILPTSLVILCFVLSNAISVYIYSYKPLRDDFYQNLKELE